MITAMLFAGGSGARMQSSDLPKQFLEVGGKPIIIHTIEKFVIHPGFDQVLVLVPKAWVGYTQDIIRKYIPAAYEIPVLSGVPLYRLHTSGGGKDIVQHLVRAVGPPAVFRRRHSTRHTFSRCMRAGPAGSAADRRAAIPSAP